MSPGYDMLQSVVLEAIPELITGIENTYILPLVCTITKI
jgi:hypothetical protein